MKGFMIYETPAWGDEDNVVYTQEVNNASYTLKQVGADDNITCYLEGTATKESVTKATCNKDDTYDFEIGALIALMKKCGVDKVVRACNEAFSEDTFKTYATMYERELNTLKEENKRLKETRDNLYDYNKELIDEIDQKNHEIISLKSLKLSNENLKEEIKSLKKAICAKKVINDKLLKDYNAAQSSYEIMVEKSADLMDEVKKLEEENEKLKKENYLWENSDKSLRREVKIVRDALNMWKHKYIALKAENEKLKLDCEKLQHGYNDTDMTSPCPSWLDGKKWNYVSIDELSFKPSPNLIVLSKREKMWDEILKEGRTPIYVKREDIRDFLKECQVVGIKWVSGRMPLETMPFYMTDGYDGAYFFIMTSLDISKSKRGAKEFRHVMSWWTTASDEEAKNSIKYIRPMRWDLFAKGRLAVKVDKENYSEFCSRVLSHFDKVGISAFNHAGKFGYYAFNKDTDYVERLLTFDYGDVKEINRHKVVDWEDVR